MSAPIMRPVYERKIAYWQKRLEIAQAYFDEYGVEWWSTHKRDYCEEQIAKNRALLHRSLAVDARAAAKREAANRWLAWPHP